ncbi:tetratricopeptide repeat protein [uncultured Roseovarius sp.]|uniref:tetratricopeptide repeat protein n=1 Tax=uncultured Roseovarius sp. TaxID=293344 RepID=UPI00261F4A3E|nr:tetratricopeptide repeat protein [uncultured Roseovarius sp.]
MPIWTDKHDLQVTASSEQTVQTLDQFGDGLLGFTTQVDIIVDLADTDHDCPVAQAYAAQFFASAETADGMQKAQAYLSRAKALAPHALPREQAIIQAAEHWCKTERRSAAKVLEQVLDDHPTDIITAKWAQALHFDTGNPAGILRAPLKVAAACDANPYLHGMLAFGYEECHLLDDAERAVHRAVSLNRAEPWAHHAMAHVNEARNTMDVGIQFMMDVSDTWTGLTSFMTTHNWWHVCLFLIDLDRGHEALDIYDQTIWALNQNCVQDQINGISLLYRLERIGLDVGNRWHGLAAQVAANASSQVSVFLDFQFLYALARAEHSDAPKMVDRMIARADTASEDEKVAWVRVAAPAASGVLALANKDYVTAAQQFAQALPFLQCIGGSHAQRDLFELFYLDALRGSEQWAPAQQILAMRHLGRPGVSWLKTQLQEAYDNLGLGQVLTGPT